MAEEKNFENKIKKLLKDKGAWYIKYWGGAEFTKSGVPDILACHCGFFLGIEVKASHGKPSALQIHNLRDIHDAGGYAILLYPEDWNTFEEFMVNISQFGDGGSAYTTLCHKWLEWERKFKK